MTGNLWDFYLAGPVCVTTNTMIKNNGELVMGAGIAKQAKQRWPSLPAYAAPLVKTWGDSVIYCPMPYNLFLFPTKHHWRDPSKTTLISKSAKGLRSLMDTIGFNKVFLTPPGCGNGGLHWALVKPLLEPYFDDRFNIVIV